MLEKDDAAADDAEDDPDTGRPSNEGWGGEGSGVRITWGKRPRKPARGVESHQRPVRKGTDHGDEVFAAREEQGKGAPVCDQPEAFGGDVTSDSGDGHGGDQGGDEEERDEAGGGRLATSPS